MSTRKDNFRGRDKQELCNVMYIEQQNRNVTEEFGWNDASLLTGEMILGAEMLSDQKMEAQMKTQVELDEEVSSCHDKLYEGDFKILVDPVILDGITIPEKKRVVLDTDGKSNLRGWEPLRTFFGAVRENFILNFDIFENVWKNVWSRNTQNIFQNLVIC